MAAKFLFMKRVAAALTVVMASVGVSSTAFAVGSSWVGGAGATNSTKRDWFNTTNWVGGVPGSSGVANFGSSNSYIVNVNSNTAELAALNISSAAASPYQFAGNGSIVVNGSIVNDKAGVKINNLNFTGNSTISGGGTTEVYLNASSSNGSALTVTNHTLLVNGAVADVDMVVNAGGVLKATSTATLGDVDINAGGTLSGYGDGNYMQGEAINLHFTSGASAATVYVQDLSNYDSFSTSGQQTFNGALTIDWAAVGGNTFASWSTFGLFNGPSHTGNFTSVTLANAASPYTGLTFTADGAEWKTQTFTGDAGQQQWLVFQSTTGNLMVVPEPSTMVFAGVGVAMAGWSAWKKRRLAKVLAKKA